MIGSLWNSVRNLRTQSPLVQVILYCCLLTVAIFLGQYIDPLKAQLWNILPITIGSLSHEWWRAFCFTAGATLVAWIAAVVIGYALAVFVAAAKLSASPEDSIRRGVSVSVDVMYRFIYIVPFVITANIAYNMTFTWQHFHEYPRWISGVAMVLVAGASLGGYKVFISIFGAVTDAKLDSVLLTKSLFCAPHSRNSNALSFRQSITIVLRLRDCEIAGFTRALEDAFHLSLVAVMIVESVLPAFYEHFVPSTASFSNYFGGLGRMIVSAQQSLTPRHVSGVLWLVLIFDGIAIGLIRVLCSHRWHKHYHQQRKENA